MKPIAEALEVSRSHLILSLKQTEETKPNFKRVKSHFIFDENLALKLIEITNCRPSYGYRRAGAVLNRQLINRSFRAFEALRLSSLYAA